MKNQFIEMIKNFGEFNNWKGYVDQYFNTKNQRELKKYLGALTVAIGAALYGGEADD